jgi:hypothetical protein
MADIWALRRRNSSARATILRAEMLEARAGALTILNSAAHNSHSFLLENDRVTSTISIDSQAFDRDIEK